jgi:hypothetical protein
MALFGDQPFQDLRRNLFQMWVIFVVSNIFLHLTHQCQRPAINIRPMGPSSIPLDRAEIPHSVGTTEAGATYMYEYVFHLIGSGGSGGLERFEKVVDEMVFVEGLVKHFQHSLLPSLIFAYCSMITILACLSRAYLSR